jgi:hypothetical protein
VVIQPPRLRPRVTLARLAALGALLAALGLAGCGRKTGLDPPPMAAAGDLAANGQSGPVPAPGPDGKPVPPPTAKRISFLDWLID